MKHTNRRKKAKPIIWIDDYISPDQHSLAVWAAILAILSKRK